MKIVVTKDMLFSECARTVAEDMETLQKNLLLVGFRLTEGAANMIAGAMLDTVCQKVICHLGQAEGEFDFSECVRATQKDLEAWLVENKAGMRVANPNRN